MYWLTSIFNVECIKDLNLLDRIYNNIMGELNIINSNDEVIGAIEWIDSPFRKLINLVKSKSIAYPFRVVSRLDGPKTVIGVAPRIKKLDASNFNHENKELLLKYADHMDKKLLFEMKRDNDMPNMGPLNEKLLSLDDLILAARLSKYATRICIDTHGIIVANERCTYLISFIAKCDDNEKGYNLPKGLIFDKDDGFMSILDYNMKVLNYMNECFNKWKEAKYLGTLSDYCEKYSDVIF